MLERLTSHRTRTHVLSCGKTACWLPVATCVLQCCFEENDVFTFIVRQSMRTNCNIDEHEFCLVHLDDTTLFRTRKEKMKLLFKASNNQIYNASLSSTTHAQILSHLGRDGHTLFNNLQHRCMRSRAISRTEPLF